ncbi:hypothetical protein SALBM311S_04534 [Streptomyces alboniger]
MTGDLPVVALTREYRPWKLAVVPTMPQPPPTLLAMDRVSPPPAVFRSLLPPAVGTVDDGTLNTAGGGLTLSIANKVGGGCGIVGTTASFQGLYSLVSATTGRVPGHQRLIPRR